MAERTRELAMVLEVSNNITSTLDLQPLLAEVLSHLQAAVAFTGAAICTRQGDDLVYVAYHGAMPAEEMLGRRIPLKSALANQRVMESRAPLIIDDIFQESPLTLSFRQVASEHLQQQVDSIPAWLGVPLLHKDRVLGMLSLSHNKVGHYTDRHARLALAIANQAALAIENARLYARAQETATLDERARLARELHDSVTQALFSMTLHVRAAELGLQRAGIDAGGPLAGSLHQLSELTQGALAEMRALIFELRPNALAEEGRAVALRKQAAALTAREELRSRWRRHWSGWCWTRRWRSISTGSRRRRCTTW